MRIIAHPWAFHQSLILNVESISLFSNPNFRSHTNTRTHALIHSTYARTRLCLLTFIYSVFSIGIFYPLRLSPLFSIPKFASHSSFLRRRCRLRPPPPPPRRASFGRDPPSISQKITMHSLNCIAAIDIIAVGYISSATAIATTSCRPAGMPRPSQWQRCRL